MLEIMQKTNFKINLRQRISFKKMYMYVYYRCMFLLICQKYINRRY